MNIDINKDIAVCFDRDGRPLNCYGEVIPRKGFKVVVNQKLGAALRRAQKEIEPPDQKNTK